MSEKKTIEATAAVIQHEGKFLITKRPATSPLGHCWEFPGGKIEKGETIEECVVREVKEEVGIEAKVKRRLQSLWYDYTHGRIHLHFVLCDYVSGTPQTLGCTDIKWIEAHEFPDYDFPPADVGVIKTIISS